MMDPHSAARTALEASQLVRSTVLATRLPGTAVPAEVNLLIEELARLAEAVEALAGAVDALAGPSRS